MNVPAPVRSELDLPLVVTSLMKGPVYRDAHERVWLHLLALQSQARDFVATVGLILVVDEAEGYAFLRQRPDVDDDGQPAIPRLVARRALSYPVSLLLALLRKRLAQADADGGDTRLVLTKDQVVDLLVTFLPPSSNEVRIVDQVDAHLAKVVALGFLRRVPGPGEAYEVRRILKAFVDAQWLADFDARLAAYADGLGAGAGGDADA
jgi:hypothetical protein